MKITRTERTTTDYGNDISIEDLSLNGRAYTLRVDNTQVSRRITISVNRPGSGVGYILKMVVEGTGVRFEREIPESPHDDDTESLEEFLCVITDETKANAPPALKNGCTFWSQDIPNPKKGRDYFYVPLEDLRDAAMPPRGS